MTLGDGRRGLEVSSWVFGVQVAAEGVELRPRRSQEARGSLELQNGGLRALKEAWIKTFRLKHSLSSLVVFCASRAGPGSSRRCPAASQEVSEGQGRARSPERWPESTGRGPG